MGKSLLTSRTLLLNVYFCFRVAGTEAFAACLEAGAAGVLIAKAPPDEVEVPPGPEDGSEARDDSAPVDFSFVALLPSGLNFPR